MQARQYLERPLKEAMRELPVFSGLPLQHIVVIRSTGDLDLAHRELVDASHVGFDTESKPTFLANQPQTGPHLVQVATPRHAFLFLPTYAPSHELLAEIIQSQRTLKVGFGLTSDSGPLQRRFGATLQSTVELSAVVRRLGYRQQVGLQAAVAIVLGQYLSKSKRITTSNWSAHPLSDAQKLYAANDAYASLCVYRALLASAPKLLAPV